jgi:hypothetical protein
MDEKLIRVLGIKDCSMAPRSLTGFKMELTIRKCILILMLSATVPIWASVDYSSMSLQELNEVNLHALEKRERKAFLKAHKKAFKQSEKERKAKEKAEAKAKARKKKARKKQEELEALQNIPVCFTDFNCERKWAAARDWVIRNAGYKIQIYSDDLIETHNSTGSSMDLHARVLKTLLGGVGESRVYRIELTVGCANIFGCSPDVKTSIRNFNKAVGAVNTTDPDCYKALVHAMKSTPPIGIYAVEFYDKVLVKQVCLESPADRAGIQVDDVIAAVDGIEISSQQNLIDSLITIRAGDLVNLSVKRRRRDFDVDVQFPNLSELDSYSRTEAKQVEKTARDRLAEIKHLLDSGFITNEEYADKKKEIIDSL